jgi:hypothetical protein
MLISIDQDEYKALVYAANDRARLLALINTPELVDFPKAVHLEAVHQIDRWGTEDRQGKEPNDWFWLVGHLTSRALEHHKEADRVAAELESQSPAVQAFCAGQITHHREKATHHCITAAAALNH